MPCHFFDYLYSEEENTSYLKNKYFTDGKTKSKSPEFHFDSLGNKGKPEIALKDANTKEIMLKCEVQETGFKIDDDDGNFQDGDNYEMDNLSDNENGILSSTSCEDKVKSELDNDKGTKNSSSVGKEKSKVWNVLLIKSC